MRLLSDKCHRIHLILGHALITHPWHKCCGTALIIRIWVCNCNWNKTTDDIIYPCTNLNYKKGQQLKHGMKTAYVSWIIDTNSLRVERMNNWLEFNRCQIKLLGWQYTDVMWAPLRIKSPVCSTVGSYEQKTESPKLRITGPLSWIYRVCNGEHWFFRCCWTKQAA